MIDIACVGILVADVMVKPVNQLPPRGTLDRVDAITLHSGGNAMTAALNIRKLGLTSALVGKVGSDPFGDFLLGVLEERGIDASGVCRSKDCQTSCSVVLSAEDGERTFLHCVGANATLGLEEINMEVIGDARIVFVTGSFLLDRFDGPQTAELLRRCKELGKTTALDVCWDSRGRWMSLLEPAMPYLDIFMPSIDEARALSGRDSPQEMARVFFDKGVGSVVIKLGKDGCYLQASPQTPGVILPTYQDVPVVDTTGAGDSFCSGYLTALARGAAPEDCGRFANAVGTHCVMAKGATTGIRSYEEILQFMKEKQ